MISHSLGRAFGLIFRSEYELPELAPWIGPIELVDVDIRWRSVPESLGEGCVSAGLYQATPEALLLRVPGVVALHVTANCIEVEPAPGATESSVRTFLLGSALGALLHLRGRLAMHSSAVVTPDGQVALFCGQSTAGKSTLAAALAQRGHAMLADDLAAVWMDADGQPWCLPGLSRAKLWGKALAQLGMADRAEESLRTAPGMDKYAVSHATATEARPLTRCYELQVRQQGELAFAPVMGIEKINTLVGHTFRLNFLRATGRQATHLRQMAALAPRLSLTRIQRPEGVMTLDAICDALEMQWAS